jgi:hypothetical protein
MKVDMKTIFRSALIVVSMALIVCVSGYAVSLMQVSVIIPNAGAVKGVGVEIYWDSACTNPTTSIVWGTMDKGSSKQVTLYVKNTGNAAATLTKTIRNWSPTTAANYFSVTWDYANQTIGVNKALQVNLTLSIASTVTAITSFNFDLIITATG